VHALARDTSTLSPGIYLEGRVCLALHLYLCRGFGEQQHDIVALDLKSATPCCGFLSGKGDTGPMYLVPTIWTMLRPLIRNVAAEAVIDYSLVVESPDCCAAGIERLHYEESGTTV
jgi:hypothetical protein